MDAFGMQRTMLAGGTVDADGFLVDNPSEPAWNLLHIHGPLDPARLSAAVAQVTSAIEILHLRVRATDAGPTLVPHHVPIELDVLEVPAPLVDGQLAPEVAAMLGPLLFDKVVLPDAPSGRVCLVHGAGDEHLLALSFDHTVLDGWAVGLLTKAIAQCYKSGRHTPRGPSFREFVGALPDRATQDANLAEWQQLLAGHPVPGPALRFPGSVPKPPPEYRIDGYYDATCPAAVVEDLTAAVQRTGLSRAEVLTSACALAVTSWSDGPQPMLSLRHGHSRPEDILVIGPLVEPYVLLPPSPEPATVADWLVAHSAANRDTPSLHGRSIREVTPLAPRNAALNVVPPARPVSFGAGTRAVTVARDLLAPLWADGRPTVPSTAAFWVNLFLDQPGRVEISITYDSQLLPEPALLADSIASVVASAARARAA
jgi:hypothetical protein